MIIKRNAESIENLPALMLWMATVFGRSALGARISFGA
jgi:hypothetical protein